MNFRSTPQFRKKFKKISKNNPLLVKQFNQKLEYLKKDRFHPSLRTHKLSGALHEHYSISLNMSLRVILKVIDDTYLFTDIGTHDEVY